MLTPVSYTHLSLNWFYDHYQLPMFIVENGFGAIDVKEADGTVNDQYRIDYLRAHIEDVYKRQWQRRYDCSISTITGFCEESKNHLW